MDLRFMTREEWPIYQELFLKCFGEWDRNQFPQMVVFATEGKDISAFASFTRVHVNTVRLQYLGTLPKKRSIKLWNLFPKFLEFVKDEHLKFVIIRIAADNKVALLSAIHQNFVPRGFVAGHVELAKEL